MIDLWSKSERESGVKFDIQRDSTSKIFQQPKYDALTNCNTEHVTENLFTTVSQKSKSYLDSAKGNLADNNNNQTFPTRPILEQGVAENEGVTTAESPTAKMEVVLTAESPTPRTFRDEQEIRRNNKGVPTAESPTAKMEVVPTAESPTPQTSRDERAICRNSKNPSGHMENEEDKIQVNFLSPSTINIKQARRVTYSVNTLNEVSQSSTSVPSEGEALHNVVDVDPISRPHYEPIDMTAVGLQRSKRRKSEKNKCYSTIKNIGFTAYCAFATMTNSVRGQIAKILASRDLQNFQRAHSNVDWTINICQLMALITVMTGKYTLAYG